MSSLKEKHLQGAKYTPLQKGDTLQSNLNSTNNDGSFTMSNSNSFLSPYEILLIAEESKCFGKFSFLFLRNFMLYVRGDFNEYTQHTIIVRKIKNTSLNDHHLLPDLAP